MTTSEKKAYAAVRGAHADAPVMAGGCDENGCNIEHLLIEADDSDSGCFVRDSGARTEFPTGAVRDMREGKGRCDLMPLDVVATYLAATTTTHISNIVSAIAKFQKTLDSVHLYSSLRLFSEYYPKWKGSDATMFLEVARQFEDGAKKYGDNNWQKGVPVYCYIDSAVRHYLKWLRGDSDEPHDRAFVWNILCCIWEIDLSGRHKGGEAKV